MLSSLGKEEIKYKQHSAGGTIINNPGVFFGLVLTVKLEITYAIGIVLYMNIKILVHWGEGGPMLEVIWSQAFVYHVVVQCIEELNVDIAHQSIQNFLKQ